MQGGAYPEKKQGNAGNAPPHMGGADPLARQQPSRREFVERRAHVLAVIEVPAAYQCIGEGLHSVTVVALQIVDQAGCYGADGLVSYPCAALKRHRERADGLPVPSGPKRQNVTMSGRTNG